MLDTLKQKIQQLISAYESERTEKESLQATLQEVMAQNEAYRKQIDELERQIDNLRLAEAFKSAGDNAEARKRIDRLIREVDRCITLMEG